MAALATATGGPVFVLRVSGKNLSFLESLFDSSLPAPGSFELKNVFSQGKSFLDKALVLYFRAPKSFTGEDVVEIQGHGASAIVESIFEELKNLGVQRALPGEFSFRAVLNNKMTLEEAEAMNFVLKADSLPSKQSSELLGLKSIPQKTRELFEELKEDLQIARGRFEAAIDFPEAELEQGAEIASGKEKLLKALSTLRFFENAYNSFRKSYSLPTVGIVGNPNAGKSTLLNILVGGEKALVSPIAGTTRDLIEAKIRLPSGRELLLVDTAGIRSFAGPLNKNDVLEEKGIQKSLGTIEDSQALVWVRNLSQSEDPEFVNKIQKLKLPVLELFTHKDLLKAGAPEPSFDLVHGSESILRAHVFSQLENLVSNSLDSASESSHILWLSERQAKELNRVEEFVRSALDSLNGSRPFELIGDDLRAAEAALLAVLGKDLGEEYIGQIFSQFCLGK